jgi:Sigma-70, region 4
VIAERFGLSEVRVSQLHNRALERLRIRAFCGSQPVRRPGPLSDTRTPVSSPAR